MDNQYVYVLTNPAMPGLVKIGMTSQNDPSSRPSQLYSSGVPLPFDTVFMARVEDAAKVETAIHVAFSPYRINPKREFFSIKPEQAIAVLELLHIPTPQSEISALEGVVPDDEKLAAENFKKRRPNLNFSEMGIPVGATLQFTKGHETVTVASAKKVWLQEEEVSLTVATRALLGLPYSVAPAPYWTWEGKSLSDLYNQTYPLGED